MIAKNASAVHETRQETEFTLNWVVDRLLQRSFAKIKELEAQYYYHKNYPPYPSRLWWHTNLKLGLK